MAESEDEDGVVAAQPRRSPRKRRAVQLSNDSSTDSTEKAPLKEEDLSDNDESSGSENEATKAKGAAKKPTINEENSDPEMAVLEDKMKSDVDVLSEKHKHDITAIQVTLDEVSKDNKDLKAAIAKSLADAENVKAELGTQIAALQDEMKLGKSDNVNIHNKLKKMHQATQKFADTERTKVDFELARKAKHDMIFDLLMKRKQLQDAGISDSVIDEQLPLPGKDEDEPPAKKQRLVTGKTEDPE
jgi:cupin superfamily acireductone dioxygenase involved in methionine salvage